MSEFSDLFAASNYMYIPAFDLPESPRTPGFEGSVRQVYEKHDLINEHGDLLAVKYVLLTEVFDDLGRVAARAYTFLTEYPAADWIRVRAMCAAVDSNWGEVAFSRPYTSNSGRRVNLYARVNPQRMKLDPGILAAASAAQTDVARTRDDESVRVSDPSVAAVVAGAGGSMPNERRAE